jgi:hypothetical protein
MPISGLGGLGVISLLKPESWMILQVLLLIDPIRLLDEGA